LPFNLYSSFYFCPLIVFYSIEYPIITLKKINPLPKNRPQNQNKVQYRAGFLRKRREIMVYTELVEVLPRMDDVRTCFEMKTP